MASKEKKILEEHIKIQQEKEKKYAKEQTFYNEENYDFRGAEVNPESVKSLKELQPQYDLDMDDVYD
jgi:1-aminocyclopropane-1-carboxylate deaminase/D-cysteine desulfhydrase-like pyridoxal-dependent ACC family enzyme